MRDWQAEKGGVRRGESRNGCPPPASPFVRDKKLVYIAGDASNFCIPGLTLPCQQKLHSSMITELRIFQLFAF